MVHSAQTMRMHGQEISGRSQTSWRFQHATHDATRNVDFWLCYWNEIRQTEPPNILVFYEDIPYTQAARLLPYEKTRSSRKSLKARKSTQLKARI